MGVKFLVASCACLVFTITSVLRADEVIRWNNLLLDSVRAELTPPPVASRKMAITHIAIYDAVNSIDQRHEPYIYFTSAPSDLPLDAAIAQAAHDTLSALFPLFNYDAELEATLNLFPDGPQKTAAIKLGKDAAIAILVERTSDPSGMIAPGSPPALGPGVWRPTPPANASYLLPGWATMTPFSMLVPDQFRGHKPPELKSGSYTRAFNRVKSIGRKVSLERTTDQTQIAFFWADGPGTATPPGHWNVIAQSVSSYCELTSAENARLFALLNITMADAAIVAWDMKFEYYFWRPITAIRSANTDGNSKTQQESDWEPLINTPPFPAYVSGHSTFSGSAATLLSRFFGTDDVEFSTTTDAVPLQGAFRSFPSFSAAAAEAGQSRIYGGIHFDFDDKNGQQAGQQLAKHVYRQLLRRKCH